jgi:hypothetical protein
MYAAVAEIAKNIDTTSITWPSPEYPFSRESTTGGGEELHRSSSTGSMSEPFHEIYGDVPVVRERFCPKRWVIDIKFALFMRRAGFEFIVQDKDGDLIDAFKYRHHPWYVGVNFSPEYSTAVMKANPFFFGFVQAVFEHDQKRREDYKKRRDERCIAFESGTANQGDLSGGYEEDAVDSVLSLAKASSPVDEDSQE